jgi:hypothetical protein
MNLINFVTIDDLLDAPKPDPLIDGYLQEQDAVCLYGEPNGGKSFLALDWALCIATGKPWLDMHEVKQGPVVYMAGEGGASLQVRVQAWMQHHGIREIHGGYFQTRPLPLRDEDTVDEILATLDMMAQAERGAGEDGKCKPRLIVVDTLSQFMMGGDENGPDMALFVANCRRLSHDINTAILIVHHTNKGGVDPRGHSALRGNVDEMFSCRPVYQDHRLVGIDVANDKQRDKARAATLNLKLKVVVLGKDKRGEDIDSLVVLPTLAPPSKLPKVRQTLLDILDAMLQVENIKTERCINKDIAFHLGDEHFERRGVLKKQLDELHHKGLVKHGVGKSYLTTLGRAVLDNAGIRREKED